MKRESLSLATPAVAAGIEFRLAFVEVGWRLHQTLVWVKHVMVLGHSDYHYRHEDMLYGYKAGSGRPGRGKHPGTRWYGDHAQTSVFEIDRPTKSPEHPTVKPVELVARCLLNSSRRGHAILDPFIGSGTTLVAAAQHHRSGYGVEIDPKYVAVALERLSGMGLKPRLVK